MTNNLKPGVYVVLPGGETEHWVPEEMDESAKYLGQALSNLVTFFQSQWLFLDQNQATWLAAAVVHSLPALLQENPEFLTELSQLAGHIKAGRHKNGR